MNTPWADGVPGLTQRPIQTGATFKYKWHANSYGSYFYHAHTRGQIDDGAYGPIVIRPQPGIPKPFDMICDAEPEDLEDAEANVQSVILTDWRHRTSDLTWSDQVASGFESAICMDSLLINGKGAVDCWAQEDIDGSVDQSILPLMNRNGLKLTKKGYVTVSNTYRSC
jgi:FtsP/CotA-like multicopper oxidase with cupredoxin domain